MAQLLLVEDDAAIRGALIRALTEHGHAVASSPGAMAGLRQVLEAPPDLVLLDLGLPDLEGYEALRMIRAVSAVPVVIITARDDESEIIRVLDAGADDYVIKPFDREELRARLQAGIRILNLQAQLQARVHELEEAIARVRTLQGLLPICSYCKRVRNDGDYWQQVESYISDHSDARFSHGICPDCFESVVRPQLQTLSDRKAG